MRMQRLYLFWIHLIEYNLTSLEPLHRKDGSRLVTLWGTGGRSPLAVGMMGRQSLPVCWLGWMDLAPRLQAARGSFQEGSSPLERVSAAREEGTVYLLSQAGNRGRFQRGQRPPWLWVSNRGERHPVGTRSCCARSSVLYLSRTLPPPRSPLT